MKDLQRLYANWREEGFEYARKTPNTSFCYDSYESIARESFSEFVGRKVEFEEMFKLEQEYEKENGIEYVYVIYSKYDDGGDICYYFNKYSKEYFDEFYDNKITFSEFIGDKYAEYYNVYQSRKEAEKQLDKLYEEYED